MRVCVCICVYVSVYVSVLCVCNTLRRRVAQRERRDGGRGMGGSRRTLPYLLHTAVLEWWALKMAHQMVLTRRHHAEWPHRTVIDGVNGLAVSCDLSHRGARVPQYDMSKPATMTSSEVPDPPPPSHTTPSHTLKSLCALFFKATVHENEQTLHTLHTHTHTHTYTHTHTHKYIHTHMHTHTNTHTCTHTQAHTHTYTHMYTCTHTHTHTHTRTHTHHHKNSVRNVISYSLGRISGLNKRPIYQSTVQNMERFL